MIQFRTLDTLFLEDAKQLVIQAYQKEREAIPYLPPVKWFYESIHKPMENLLSKGLGIMAIKDNKLIGFIAGYKVNNFFGTSNGIYVPLYGHSVNFEYERLYQKIYQHCADLWVKQKYLSHVITLFTHNEPIIQQWFWMGFGLRCVDGICQVSKLDITNHICVKKINKDELFQLVDLHQQHINYYSSSPLFMPSSNEDPLTDLEEWFNQDNHHMWVAYDNDKAIGYIRIQPNGESIISHYPLMMNITGAYVLESYRNQGIASRLLNECLNWLYDNKYLLCGVDFESFNVNGSNFWLKHFIPYTFSMTRRIDERIIEVKL